MAKLLKGLDALNEKIAIGIKQLLVIFMAMQVSIIFFGVIFRYFLNNPIVWVDEVSTLLLVVITFLGCYIAHYNNNLARIELLIDKFKGRLRTIVYIISEIISLTMLVIIVYLGFKLFMLPTSLKQTTPGIFIPLWIFYALIPATFSLNVLTTISRIFHYYLENKEA